VCDLETSRIGAPYIYDISNLRVNETWIFGTVFSKNIQILNLIKILEVGAELLHVDGRTGVTKLTVDFRNFANAPENETSELDNCTFW